MVYYTCVVYNIRKGEVAMSMGLQASVPMEQEKNVITEIVIRDLGIFYLKKS